MRLVVHYDFKQTSCFVSLPQSLICSIESSLVGPQNANGARRNGSSIFLLQWASETASKAQKHRAHVGCIGGVSAEGIIVMPYLLAEALGIHEGSEVYVSATPKIEGVLPRGEKVFVEPLTCDDSEIIELNPGFVQENLLRQIDVFNLDMHFPIHIRGSVCFLKTVFTGEGRMFAQLLGDSELVVIPKSRRNDDSLESPSTPLKLRVESVAACPDGGFVFSHPKVLLALGVNDGDYVVLYPSLFDYADNILSITSDSLVNTKKKPSPKVMRIFGDAGCRDLHIACPSSLKLVLDAPDGSFLHVSAIKNCMTSIKKVQAIDVSLRLIFVHTSLQSELSVPQYMQQDHESLVRNFFASVAEFVSSTFPDLTEKMYLPLSGENLFCLSSFNSSMDILLEINLSSSTNTSVPSPNIPDCNLLSMDASLRTRIIDENHAFLVKPSYLHSFMTTLGISDLGGFLLDSPWLDSFTEARLYCNHVLFPPTRALQTNSLFGGLTITGPAGIGKTTFAMALSKILAQECQASIRFFKVSCSDFVSQKQETVVTLLDSIFKDALCHRPSIVFFDDIDRFFRHGEETMDLHHELRLLRILEKLNDLVTSSDFSHGILLLATSRSMDTMHQHLKSPSLFGKEIALPLPNGLQRKDIIQSILHRGCQKELSAEDLELLEQSTEGSVVSDLSVLVDRIQVHYTDLADLLKTFVPASLRSFKQPTKELISWNDIGGLEEVREVLKETLMFPTKYSLLFKESPLKLRSGVMLYGPPGCGKTYLASAVAQETGLNFISIKGPELLDKYIGASEEAVRKVFERAQGASPCIIFFDEFESVAPRRGNDSTGVTDRVVNQLLCHLDGVEARSGVFVMGATSRPDLVDPALLRPGRLDKCLYCGIPDFDARKAIISNLLNKVVTDGIDSTLIAEITENYTGADLNGIFTAAQTMALHEIIDSGNSELVLQEKHILKAVQDSKPSVSPSEQKRFSRIYADFLGSRKGEFSLQFREGKMKMRTALK